MFNGLCELAISSGEAGRRMKADNEYGSSSGVLGVRKKFGIVGTDYEEESKARSS